MHAEKAGMECKYWLNVEDVEIREAFAFQLSQAARREVKKIIYQHFDLIVEAWNKNFNKQ